MRPPHDIELKPMTRRQALGTLPRAGQENSQGWHDYGLKSSSKLQDHYDSSKMSPYELNAMKVNEAKQAAWAKGNPVRDGGKPAEPNAQEQSSSLEDSYDPEVASTHWPEVERRSKM